MNDKKYRSLYIKKRRKNKVNKICGIILRIVLKSRKTPERGRIMDLTIKQLKEIDECIKELDRTEPNRIENMPACFL
nr:MAG TPA: hypothetical protein [Caudoviricetes sp.]